MKTAFILASLLLASPVAAATYPPLNGKPVVDAANIIPADREAALNTKLFEIEKRTKHQVAVLTVPSLDGDSPANYANLAFRQYKLGDAKRNDGVLFMIAPNERKNQIEVGYGLEGRLTDAESNRINREDVLPLFRKGDLVGGIEAGVAGIDTVISKEEVIPAKPQALVGHEGESSAFWTMFWALIIIGIPTLIIYFVLRARRKEREAQAAYARQARRDSTTSRLDKAQSLDGYPAPPARSSYPRDTYSSPTPSRSRDYSSPPPSVVPVFIPSPPPPPPPSPSYSDYSSPSPSPSPSPSFDGGGGSSGGGGDGGSW